MMHTAAIIEMDAERDRKICVSLDLKVTGANRELAQWLLDHPRYSAPVVAGWLGCEERRIQRLRAWARDGFIDLPSSRYKRRPTPVSDSALKSQENFQDDDPEHDMSIDADRVEDPDKVEEDVLYQLSRHGAWADGYRKVFKVSSFDAEAKKRISIAIDKLIKKWRLTQATLARKERS
jgi:hypothetical protein